MNTNKYLQYLEDLEENHDIHLLAFVEEHILFTTFLSSVIRNDDHINDEERNELIEIMKKAYKRLENKFEEIEESRLYCWSRFEDLKQSSPRVSNYYRVIVTLFYELNANEDPTSQFTSFELFFELINDIDEQYPQLFHQMVLDKKIIVE